jgi:hypothetical protein
VQRHRSMFLADTYRLKVLSSAIELAARRAQRLPERMRAGRAAFPAVISNCRLPLILWFRLGLRCARP